MVVPRALACPIAPAGLIGAFVGTWFARSVGLPEVFTLEVGDEAIPIVWTIVGSALILFLLAVLRRGARGRAI